jgi:L-alanine-DL-glutamate epimerase-like enolase superfamily enzyme
LKIETSKVVETSGVCRQENLPVKITAVEIIPLSYAINDNPPRRRFFAVLKVSTDEGVVGWGEASDCYGHSHPLTVRALFEEKIKWMLIGQDPRPLDQLMVRLRRHLYHPLGARELVIQCLSAVDIALWDIRGKLENRPISAILGAHRDRLSLYAATKPAFHEPIELHLARIERLTARGVRAAKLRVGRDLHWDETYVREMRALVPPEVELLVDGKYNYYPDSAIRLAQVLGEIGAVYFEEPVDDTSLEEVARVAAHSPVPLAYGEHCFTVNDFRDLITHKAARVLNPDATICGGISEMMRVARLAEAHQLKLVPHCGGLTAIGMAANFHVAAALPEVGHFEYDARADQPLRDELPSEALFSNERIVDGCLPVPAGPGLGIEVDERVFARYPHEIDARIAGSYPAYATRHV